MEENNDEMVKQAEMPAQPALGHGLRLEAVRDGWCRIAPTRAQALWRFGRAFAFGAGIALLAVAAIYLPDFVFDYARRGEEFVSFFAKYIGVVAGFLVIVAAIVAARGMETVYVHPTQRRILQCGFWARPDFENAIGLEEVERFSLEMSGGFFRRTRVDAHLQGGSVTVAEVFGDGADADALERWLNALSISGALPRTPPRA